MNIVRSIKIKCTEEVERFFFWFAKKVYSERIFALYAKEKCKRECESQRFISFNERSIEYSFVFKQLASFFPVTILDVGTGTTALPNLIRNCGFVVTAIDNIHDYWPAGMLNRHFHVIDDDITNTKLNQQFDLITCISVLEHIRNYNVAVKNMFSLLKPGGHIILTCPYNENQYVENVYKLLESSVVGKNFPFVTQAYSRKELNNWLSLNGGKIIEQEYWRYFTGEFWTVGEDIIPPVKVSKDEKHQLTCILIQKCN
jgi:2-polyprenyl-3-methyl-5-hydroxy-6-metoxy-1,4-benzoquinol methylase